MIGIKVSSPDKTRYYQTDLVRIDCFHYDSIDPLSRLPCKALGQSEEPCSNPVAIAYY